MTTRRSFLKQTAIMAASSAFPAIIIPKPKAQLGVALVGLGYYSTDLLAPALQLTKHVKLKGIVTGTPSKIPVWQERHGIADSCVYNYQNMHEIANNDEIDVVYIVLPNSMHADYSIIGANAGKQVWCEKPMAPTAIECQRIIDSCRKNKVQLAIGYRMQHEPNTRTIMGYAKSKPYGKIQTVYAEAGFREGRIGHWHLDKEMGGGAMYDMGVYAFNAARYATGEEPVAVFDAKITTDRPEVFTEVDDTTICKLEFPSGAIATCKTSFSQNINQLEVTCADGWYRLAPFQTYNGIKGSTSDGKVFSDKIPNQQARQMDDDSLAIIDKTDNLVTGFEGIQDVRIIEAIFKSAESGGKRVPLT